MAGLGLLGLRRQSNHFPLATKDEVSRTAALRQSATSIGESHLSGLTTGLPPTAPNANCVAPAAALPVAMAGHSLLNYQLMSSNVHCWCKIRRRRFGIHSPREVPGSRGAGLACCCEAKCSCMLTGFTCASWQCPTVVQQPAWLGAWWWTSVSAGASESQQQRGFVITQPQC